MRQFSEEEKQEMFDEIARHFYDRNFGTMAKSDMEALMFHFIVRNSQKDDKSIDWDKIDDYALSRELGITIQKVRSLKVRSQLLFPIDYFDEEDCIKRALDNYRYDDNEKRFYISVPDPNIKLKIEDYIEKQGGYVEYQLNSKLLILRLEEVLKLAVLVEGNEKEFMKQIRKDNKEVQKLESEITPKEFKQVVSSVFDTVKDTAEIIGAVTSIVSETNPLISLICAAAKTGIRLLSDKESE